MDRKASKMGKHTHIEDKKIAKYRYREEITVKNQGKTHAPIFQLVPTYRY
jgi:hypothetical protein